MARADKFWAMNVIKSILSDKALVADLMLQNPDARDDDRILIFDYLTKYLKIDIDPIDEHLIKTGKAFESLTRARRIIQNKDGKLEATQPVRLKRMKREIDMHEALSPRVVGYEQLQNSVRIIYFGDPIPEKNFIKA